MKSLVESTLDHIAQQARNMPSGYLPEWISRLKLDHPREVDDPTLCPADVRFEYEMCLDELGADAMRDALLERLDQ